MRKDNFKKQICTKSDDNLWEQCEKNSVVMLCFHSEFISRAGYDAQREIMVLEFAEDKSRYLYHDVPENVWYSLRHAWSMKHFFKMCILGKYRETKIPMQKKFLDNEETSHYNR